MWQVDQTTHVRAPNGDSALICRTARAERTLLPHCARGAHATAALRARSARYCRTARAERTLLPHCARGAHASAAGRALILGVALDDLRLEVAPCPMPGLLRIATVVGAAAQGFGYRLAPDALIHPIERLAGPPVRPGR